MLSRYPILRVLRPYLLFCSIPILIAVILFPVFGNAREKARRSSCQSNLKQIMLGIKQYTQDNDSKFPLVAVRPVPKIPSTDPIKAPVIGWADALQPYLKSVCIYQCPSEITPPAQHSVSAEAGYIDYWMNSRLAGCKANGASLIALGDGEGLGTAQSSLHGLPADWEHAYPVNRDGGTEPPWFRRHMDGANYAFADGHVQWLRPEQIDTQTAHFIP